MIVGLLEILDGVEQLVLSLAGENGGEILQFCTVMHVVIEHIGEDGNGLVAAGGMGMVMIVAMLMGVAVVMGMDMVVAVLVGVDVLMTMGMGVGVLHAVVGVGMGVLVLMGVGMLMAVIVAVVMTVIVAMAVGVVVRMFHAYLSNLHIDIFLTSKTILQIRVICKR